MGRLEGKTAIITGAARGVGLAIAKRYVAEGAKVVIADVEEAAGGAAAASLGDAARFVRTDVCSQDDALNVVAEACRLWGDLDILVSNAGVLHTADFLEVTPADFERVLRINLIGMFLIGQAAAKQMVAQAKAGKSPGAIINMSSINARLAMPDQVPYCVSKGGVEQLTKSMALSLAPYGIRVNAIGPGVVMTELLKPLAANRTATHRILSRTPLGRIADPEEIAAVAAFLASQDASYITGETIFADGGRLALNYTVPVADE